MVQADLAMISNVVVHDAIAPAQHRCSFGWAAQVSRCCAARMARPVLLMAGAAHRLLLLRYGQMTCCGLLNAAAGHL